MVALAWVTSVDSHSGLQHITLHDRMNYSLIRQSVNLNPTQKDFTIFLECRNLAKVYHKGKLQPVTVIYEEDSIWHFGVLLDADFFARKVLVLEWNGAIDYDGVPAYSYLEKENFFSGGWQDHFQVKIVMQPTEFKYVNMVRGMVPFDLIFRERFANDGCYCASVLEPDKHPIPPKTSGISLKIPHTTNQKNLLEDDVLQYPTSLVHIHKRPRSRDGKKGPKVPEWMVSPRIAFDTSWQTFYILDKKKTRLTVESKIKNLLAIPLLNPEQKQKELQEKEFAYVKFQTFRELSKMSGCLDIYSFNEEVKRRAVSIFKFLTVEDASKGVRFRLVKETDNMDMHKKVGEGVWHSPSSPIISHQDQGLLLSFWLLDRELHPGRLTHSFSLLLQDTYARGFGSRHRTQVNGMNLFFGNHGSRMGSCSPTTPTEHVVQCQYYRQHFRDMARPLLEKIIRKLGYTAARFGRVGESLYSLLCVDNELSPCRVALVTGGATRGTQQSDRVIGFANTPHLDGTDKIVGKRLAEIKEKLIAGRKLFELSPDVDSSLLEYAEKFDKDIGFQVPTTCGYQWITKENKPVQFYCYFINNGLGTAVRIADGVGHQFYAGTFTHHTSVCLAIVNGKVTMVDLEGSMNLFAWGKGSSKSN